MFHKILVPIDFTTKNRVALRDAAEIAKCHKGQIILFHVIERIQHMPQLELKGFYLKLERIAEDRMRTLLKQLKNRKIEGSAEICFGNRTEMIVRYAKSKKINLIVLNSHKIDAKKKSHDWGSISYKVAILAQCPVLLVK